MIGLFRKRQAFKRQVREVDDFLSRIKSMNGDELGLPICVTLEAAKMAEEELGVNVYAPFPAMAARPDAALFMSKMVEELQRLDRLILAPGPMVWAHTLRATINHEVRNPARKIWSELARGVPYAERARDDLLTMYGMYPDLDRLGEVPDGFEKLE